MQRRKYSRKLKPEAFVQISQPGVTFKPIGEELGVNANMLTRWRNDLNGHGSKAFIGQGKPRDEEMAMLK